jgi:PhnB protein
MTIEPYLFFDGDCREAIEHYIQLLGGRIEFITTNAETPEAHNFPPEAQNQVMHVRAVIGGQVVMASDAPAQHFSTPQGFYLSLTADTPEEADRIWAGLEPGAKVHLQLGQTFWSPKFGMLTDRFGTPWMVSIPSGPPPANG